MGLLADPRPAHYMQADVRRIGCCEGYTDRPTLALSPLRASDRLSAFTGHVGLYSLYIRPVF